MKRPGQAWAAAGIVATLAVIWLYSGYGTGPDQIALGERLYASHCAACHGPDLRGEPDWQSPLASGRMPAPPHNSSGHTWHHGDAELFAIIKDGMTAVVPAYASNMPAFGGIMPDDEIRAVLAFIKATWPRREREYQAVRTEDEARR